MSDRTTLAQAEALKREGNARKAEGDMERAVAAYRRSLELLPDYVPSLYNLGLVLREIRADEEAEGCFRRVCELDGQDADALFHLGSLLQQRSQFEEAAAALRRALDITPGNPNLWLFLGMALRQMPGQSQASADSLRKCLELDPLLADAHYQLGLTLRELGRTTEAAACFHRVRELEPDSSASCSALGNILLDEGRVDEAIAQYRAAVRLVPDDALAHNNLGCGLVRAGRPGEALDSFRKSIDLQPHFFNAHFNLGSACSIEGKHEEALGAYQDALRLAPDDPAVRASVLWEKQHLCNWSQLDALCGLQRRAVFEHPDSPIAPFSLLSIPSTRAEQFQCARNFARRIARSVAAARKELGFAFEPEPRARLKVGYLSADLHEHATAHWTAELFELHDRSQFEIVAYSYGPDDGSEMRARLRRAFDSFVDIRRLSHAEAAARIYADGVDILVDLKGYTQNSRPEIPALRPAPVQVSFVGFPATSGAEFIDYLVADRFVVPPAHAADYSEKLVWMPGSYNVNDRQRTAGPTPPRAALGLPEGRFVFCCFNQSYKILPPVFAQWMRLLDAVPGSVLWLLHWNAGAVLNLRREAQQRGVDPARLVFAPLVGHAAHLGRMRAADLVLDTLPYNAHTVASDALWMGVPVVTYPGDTFPARVAGSQLTALGMPELIAQSPEGYETLALELARSPAKLAALREKLARNRTTEPFFDTPQFARDLERAYATMWQTYLAGGPPSAIEL